MPPQPHQAQTLPPQPGFPQQPSSGYPPQYGHQQQYPGHQPYPGQQFQQPPQQKKLDPDQMPSPVSIFCLLLSMTDEKLLKPEVGHKTVTVTVHKTKTLKWRWTGYTVR